MSLIQRFIAWRRERRAAYEALVAESIAHKRAVCVFLDNQITRPRPPKSAG